MILAAPGGAGLVEAQPGPQKTFLDAGADIAIYGGAAGGGKTYALLIEALRNVEVPGYGAVFFRRTYPQIKNQGSCWDDSFSIFLPLGGVPKETDMSWEFPLAACAADGCPERGVPRLGRWPCDACGRGRAPLRPTTVSFRHLEHEKNRFDWHGAQVPYIAMDELQQFSSTVFFYLTSRLRTAIGVRPYLRAGANADADSWLVTGENGAWGEGFISWWIDPESGYPVPERAGRVRWFVRPEGEIVWGDSPAELAARFPAYCREAPPQSVTFVPAKVQDNAALLARDPGYLGKLMALPPVERARLLLGNWKIRPAAGLMFNRTWVEVVGEVPTDVVARVRYWDKAATKRASGSVAEEASARGPARSAGVLMALVARGFVVVEDVVRGSWAPAERERVIDATARRDGRDVTVYVEQEPGSGGKESAELTVARLVARGYAAWADRPTGDKVTRAEPLSAAADQRIVKVLRAPWNEGFLAELHAFPQGRRDQVDAASGAYNRLAGAYVDEGTVEEEIFGGGPADADLARELGGAEPFVDGDAGAEWGPWRR